MFPVERVVPLLVHVLQRDEGPELMLLATRAIAYMVEAVPHAGRACVTHGAIPSLCEKLLTIEYIDLAEQSLQALEKLSVEFPDALVRGGGLMAALSYLDFFPTGFQRAALKTAKHMTRQLRPEHADLALDAVPLLLNTVHHPDGKVSGLAGRGLGPGATARPAVGHRRWGRGRPPGHLRAGRRGAAACVHRGGLLRPRGGAAVQPRGPGPLLLDEAVPGRQRP